MISQNIHPFVLSLFLSAMVVGSLALFTYRQSSPGSSLFALMSLFVALYAITYSFELLSSTLDWIWFWVKLEYVGIVSIPVTLLLFTLVYTEQNQWVSRRSVALLFVVPLIVLLLVWTNLWHGLFYTSATVEEINGHSQFISTPGIGYWLNIVYGYMLIAATFVLLIRTYITTTTFYRRQIGYFLVGILIPWLGDIVYVLFLRRVGSIDIAPVTFTLSGMVIAVGLYRYRLLDLMPVARSKLVEMTEDAWIVLDINDRLVDLNAAASSILRRKREHLLGVKIQTVLAEKHPLRACLAVVGERRWEVNLSTDDFVPHIYDVQLSFLSDWRRRPSGRLIVLHDITEQKMAEDSLRILNSQLESMVQARTAEIQAEKEKVERILQTVQTSRDQFIASISHELRTPITNLKLYLMLLEQMPIAEKGRQYQDILKIQTERLETLAQGVVELASLDSIQGMAYEQELPLDVFIASALGEMASTIETRQLQVRVAQPEEPLPRIYGQRSLVQKVIKELLKNAVAYSDEGGKISIQIDAVDHDEQQWVTLSVVNSGQGLSLVEQEKIFERFYRGTAVSQGNTPGLGVGLSLVWKIMELHNGRVTVQSHAQEGNTFTLWFPVTMLQVDA
ncbi:MAG: PAS domain S-box protein [Ardenticatenaceae bacterium]|nr:PAS domain S-box protein [Anaerolineales bacterium]MCB8941770.1 PAS domain S-box protein [Ardenticatenaceae bacterium]MCB8972881.1 PAS domain S-box protein [Ardenticatenaceae bacterium]